MKKTLRSHLSKPAYERYAILTQISDDLPASFFFEVYFIYLFIGGEDVSDFFNINLFILIGG